MPCSTGILIGQIGEESGFGAFLNVKDGIGFVAGVGCDGNISFEEGGSSGKRSGTSVLIDHLGITEHGEVVERTHSAFKCGMRTGADPESGTGADGIEECGIHAGQEERTGHDTDTDQTVLTLDSSFEDTVGEDINIAVGLGGSTAVGDIAEILLAFGGKDHNPVVLEITVKTFGDHVGEGECH